MDKTFFSTSAFDRSGGDPERRPYWETATPPNALYPQRRVFVSATWFPRFDEWTREAARAYDASLFEYSKLQNRYVKDGTVAGSLVADPPFIVDFPRGNQLFSLPEIWLNILAIQNETDFDNILAEAKEAVARGSYESPLGHCRSCSDEPGLFGSVPYTGII